MIFEVPLLIAVLFALASAVVMRAKDARLARQQGLGAAATAAAIAGVAFVGKATQGTWGTWGTWATAEMASWLPGGLLAIAPLVTGLVALLAIGLAPLVEHRKSTFARMLLLFGFAEGFLATSHPLPLAVLWAASAAVTWVEFRSWCGEEGWPRVFGVYQLVSVLFFSAGALMIGQGMHTTTASIVLLVGIGIREGVVPVHSWFVRFVERAPMGVVVAFVAPQLGVYAQLELLSGGGLGEIAPTVAAFGAITAVLAAMLGVVQTNARRAVAYLILSQTGLVAFGLESHSEVGLVGALLNWQVLALATSGLVMTLAALEARRGRRSLIRPQGSFSETPKLGVAFLVLGFASVGFPLTLGFVAEDLLVQGSVSEFPVLGLSLVVATAINGVTVLRAFFYLLMGEKKGSGAPDLCRREASILGLIVVILVTFGLVPSILVSFESPVDGPQSGGRLEGEK